MVDRDRRLLMQAIAAAVVTPLEAHASGPSSIDVHLRVRDERGRSIAHPTIWGFALPRSSPMALTGDDVWRIASRCTDSFDFATPFHKVLFFQQI